MPRERSDRTRRGSYVLLIRLAEDRNVEVGRLGQVVFSGGHYAYVGSALGGLRGRLERHLRSEKKVHWHIDYLLQEACISDIITCESQERAECAIAQGLSRRFDSVAGFGASDCRCPSHLFHSREPMQSRVMAVLESAGLAPEARSTG